MTTPALYCDVCGRDASDACLLIRWHGDDICETCLGQRDQMRAAGEMAACDCPDCVREAAQANDEPHTGPLEAHRASAVLGQKERNDHAPYAP